MSASDFCKKDAISIDNNEAESFVIYQDLLPNVVKIEIFAAWVNLFSDWSMWFNDLNNFLVAMLVWKHDISRYDDKSIWWYLFMLFDGLSCGFESFDYGLPIGLVLDVSSLGNFAW